MPGGDSVHLQNGVARASAALEMLRLKGQREGRSLFISVCNVLGLVSDGTCFLDPRTQLRVQSRHGTCWCKIFLGMTF